MTRDGYLAGGKEDVQKLLGLARASGFELQAGDRVLDFGCASGRLITPEAHGYQTAVVLEKRPH